MKELEALLSRDLKDFRPLVKRAVENVVAEHSCFKRRMACDWRVAIENSLEDAHVPFVHPTSIALLGLKLHDMVKSGKHSLAMYDIGNEKIVCKMQRMGLFFEDVWPHKYFHLYIFPYTCLASAGGFTYSMQTYLPEFGETLFESRLYRSRTTPDAPDLGFFFDEAARFNEQVFNEDAAMCEKVHIRCEGQPMKPHLRRLEWFAQSRRS